MIEIVSVDTKGILEILIKVACTVSYLLSIFITHSPIFLYVGTHNYNGCKTNNG